MDNSKVKPVVQELQSKGKDSIQPNSSGDKLEIDWIEGDSDFDPFHDDVDWCE